MKESLNTLSQFITSLMIQEGRDRTELRIGEKLKSYQYRLTSELAQEYSRVINDDNPWYYDKSPFGDPICNPSLVLNDHVRVYQYNGYRGTRGIYARGQFEFIRPLCQGKMLTITSKPRQKYIKRNKNYIDHDIEIADDEGILIRGIITEVIVPHDSNGLAK